MGIGFWIAMAIIVVIVWAMYSSQKAKDTAQAMRLKASQTLGEAPQFFWMEASRNLGLACDADLSRLCVLTNSGSTIAVRKVLASQILAVEIVEDGETIVRTSRAGQAGGMAVGGLLLGGVGAVVGGLSASQRHQSKVNSIKLRLIVDDAAKPEIWVKFLDFSADRTGSLYRQFRQFADDWHARFKVMIERAQRQAPPLAPPPAAAVLPPGGDVVGQLERLAALRSAGHLTEEEFVLQKRSLLSAPSNGSTDLAT